MAKLESPVSGRVVAVHVSAGQTVQAGEAVLTVESMKMEIPVEAEKTGTVQELLVRAEDEVTEGQIVAVLS